MVTEIRKEFRAPFIPMTEKYIVIIQIKCDTRIFPKIWPYQISKIFIDRMMISKIIDKMMEFDAGLQEFGPRPLFLRFEHIGHEISECDFGMVVGKNKMGKEIHVDIMIFNTKL